MRKTKWTIVLVAAVCAVLALGCAGDVGKQVMASPELQAKVMDMISANPETAGGMVDRLLVERQHARAWSSRSWWAARAAPRR